METASTRQLPHTLRGIQLGTVRWQEVQGEALGDLLPPFPVKSGVVVFRLSAITTTRRAVRVLAGCPKVFQELSAGDGVELAPLSPEKESAVAQADSPEVAHTLARGMMEQDGILGFGRDPHPAARAVLLKMHFVHSPEINPRVGA